MDAKRDLLVAIANAKNIKSINARWRFLRKSRRNAELKNRRLMSMLLRIIRKSIERKKEKCDMAKNSFMLKMQAETLKQERLAGLISRQQTLDKVTIALGRMGFTAEEFEEFQSRFHDAEIDFCDEVIYDGKTDRKLEYAKDKIDRVLQQYVPKHLFVSYDERYKF